MGNPQSQPEEIDQYPTGSPWNRMSDLELEAGWLTSGAASVFLMQLGFMAFEVGFVEAIWINSIIIKNIEDAIIGTLTYVFLTHTLANSSTVWGGVIGSLDNAFLIDVSKAEHEVVFINAMYAVTCTTIVSGAVLERMKNSAYVWFTFLVVGINYSIAACWAWNPGAWLCEMGFIDCAGSFVVHGVGGITSIVACYFLGARRGAYIEMHKDAEDENGKKPKRKLKPVSPATNPTMLAFGGFILWYGWFAFNVTSPIVSGTNAGQNLGQTGLNTLLAPCAASAACMIYKWIQIRYNKYKGNGNDFKQVVTMEDLMATILAGAVAITASCYTVKWWASLIIGFGSTFIYYSAGWFVREKLVIDDPLGVCSVHLFPGFYGVIMEGVFADGSVGDPGLLYQGYKHFGVQVLGAVVGAISQLLLTIFLWRIVLDELIMKRIVKGGDIRVDTLDTYLGIGLFDIDPESAFKDMIKCDNKHAKRFLLKFRQQCNNSGQGNALDFLVVIYNLRVKYITNGERVTDDIQEILTKIYRLYIDDDGMRRLNITPQEKSLIEQSLENKNITVFDNVYKMKFDELKAQLTAFLKNLTNPKEYADLLKGDTLPYRLERSWALTWITDDNDRRATLGGSDDEIEMQRPLVSKKKESYKKEEAVAVVNLDELDDGNDTKEEEDEDDEKKDKYDEGDERTDTIAMPAGGDREVTPGGGGGGGGGGGNVNNDNGNNNKTPGNTDIGRVNVHESLKADDPKDTTVGISAQASVHSEVTVVDMSMFGDD